MKYYHNEIKYVFKVKTSFESTFIIIGTHVKCIANDFIYQT